MNTVSPQYLYNSHATMLSKMRTIHCEVRGKYKELPDFYGELSEAVALVSYGKPDIEIIISQDYALWFWQDFDILKYEN